MVVSSIAFLLPPLKENVVFLTQKVAAHDTREIISVISSIKIYDM
jgi:hypothetical protein